MTVTRSAASSKPNTSGASPWHIWWPWQRSRSARTRIRPIPRRSTLSRSPQRWHLAAGGHPCAQPAGISTDSMSRGEVPAQRASLPPPSVAHPARLLQLDDHLGGVVAVGVRRLGHLELVVA